MMERDQAQLAPGERLLSTFWALEATPLEGKRSYVFFATNRRLVGIRVDLRALAYWGSFLSGSGRGLALAFVGLGVLQLLFMKGLRIVGIPPALVFGLGLACLVADLVGSALSKDIGGLLKRPAAILVFLVSMPLGLGIRSLLKELGWGQVGIEALAFAPILLAGLAYHIAVQIEDSFLIRHIRAIHRAPLDETLRSDPANVEVPAWRGRVLISLALGFLDVGLTPRRRFAVNRSSLRALRALVREQKLDERRS